MEHQEPKTGKIALNFGLLLGIIGVVFGVILHIMDLQYTGAGSAQIVNLVIMVGIIFFGINQFKKANEGFISLSQALKIGVGIAAVAAVITLIWTMAYINFIEPEFIAKSNEIRLAEYQAQNPDLSSQDLARVKDSMEMFSGPGIIAAFGLIVPIIFGLIISLVGGLIMKKQRPVY